MDDIKTFFCSTVPDSIRKVYLFYYEGFKSMTIGRYLWALILIKLFILFFVLKLFFFPNVLNERYDNDSDRAQAVREALTDK